MLSRERVAEIVGKYDRKNCKVGLVASHSALDVCDGAVEEGFRTFAVCQKGRELTYTKYFKAKRDKKGKVLRGMVDDYALVDKFSEMMSPDFQAKMDEQTGYFETFQTIMANDARIQFTPQPLFFETTTEWAQALQDIYAGADAQERLDELVDSLTTMLEDEGILD